MADPGSADAPGAFVSNLPQTALFGAHPKTRIVGALLTEDADPPTAYSANEISRLAGLDEEAIDAHVPDLLELGIIVETGELEDATYDLDEESDVVADLRRLNDDLAERVFPVDE